MRHASLTNQNLALFLITKKSLIINQYVAWC